ncbi:alpha/beta-hydrolase [Hypomontagnella monticulosa]|nr:alpha/beta-hydrolase [Hypomontagnella monticulosa]
MAKPVEIFKLPDGRNISYAYYGDVDSSKTIFYHHGFPSSHDEALVCDDVAKQHGLRVISVDRPGMASSTYQPNRRLVDWPADLLALADYLKVDRFALLAVSGGGPYVLACWNLLPRSRCIGVGILCGLFPTKLGLSGMMLMNKALFFTAQWSPWLAGRAFQLGIGSAKDDPAALERLMDETVKSRPGPDRDSWQNGSVAHRQSLTLGLKDALANGYDGAGWEARIYGTDWGFNLDELKVEPGKMVFWHGDQDVNVPVAMAEKAAKLIPNAELRVAKGEAHLSLVSAKVDEAIRTVGQMIDTA